MKTKYSIIFILSVLAIYALFASVFGHFVTDIEDRGQWGDSFGVLTSLFTAFALLALVWSIRQSDKNHSDLLEKQQEVLSLQQEELGLQRDELRHTREEIRGQKEQLEEQNKSMEHQNFEHSFYQLLNLYEKTVIQLQYLNQMSGRDCLWLVHSRFNLTTGDDTYPNWGKGSRELNLYLQSEEESSVDNIRNIILSEMRIRTEAFNTYYLINFKSYFDVITSIMKLIDVKRDIDIRNKSSIASFLKVSSVMTPTTAYVRERINSYYYVDIFKSQLSQNELAALFFYAFSHRELKDLTEKNYLLEDLDFEYILSRPDLDNYSSDFDEKFKIARGIFKNFYKHSAYGDDDDDEDDE